MRITNHALAGTVIGLTLPRPLIAVPVALLSHFLLDALPHYGDRNHTRVLFKVVLFGDMTLASLLLIFLLVAQPTHWQLAIVCACLAASPDLMWLPMWLRELRRLPAKPDNWIKRFHHNIQWGEKPNNWTFEVIWATAMVYLIARIT